MCGRLWDNPSSINLKQFPVTYKNAIINDFKNSWLLSLSTSTVLCKYRLFKNDFIFPTYLDCVPRKIRVAFTKLRLSSHQLSVETGRYASNRTPHNERYCLICNSIDLEDEYHFLLICNMYTDIRKKNIDKCYYEKPSVLKYIELVQSEDATVLNNLCKYVYEAFEKQVNVVNVVNI